MMKKKKWIWATGAILLVVLLLSLGLQWLVPSFSAQTLTEEEANTVVLGKYPGDIIKTTKTQDEYQIEMQLETGVYFIKIDAKNGNILSLEQLEKAGNLVKEEPQLTKKEIEEQIASQGELQSIEQIHDYNSIYYRVTVKKDNEEVTLKVDPHTAEIIESTKTTTQAPSENKPTSDKPKPVSENKVITEKEAIAIAAKHLKGIADDEAEFHQNPGQTPYYLVEVEIVKGEDEQEAYVQIDAYTGTVKSVNWED